MSELSKESEQGSQIDLSVKPTLTDEALCKQYQIYCENTVRHLRAELKKILSRYPALNQIYTENCECLNLDKMEYIKHDFDASGFAVPLPDYQLGDDWSLASKVTLKKAPEVSERHKLKADASFILALDKYDVVCKLKNTLRHTDKHVAVTSFHDVLDNQKKLAQHRHSELAKWLVVFAAGIAGLGVFSYWTAKAAHHKLFTPQCRVLLLDPVAQLRKGLAPS